jgi:catechol 2,3-dioxygenase-like lactoylglutathione lyase family enzyme
MRPFLAIDHVQLAMPAGEEPRARAFYAGALGMDEVPKPPDLAARGGCWFESGGVRVHLGVETPFVPARKAHPGIVCVNLDGLLRRLAEHDVPVTMGGTFEDGARHAYVHDPFGNRLELIG